MAKQPEQKPKWHHGPPPSVGWWPTRASWGESLRWWDGSRWSVGAFEHNSEVFAGEQATRPTSLDRRLIMWTERPDSWPERSRT